MSSLSSSGARIRGDDYQHLIAWIKVVEATMSNSNVLEIGIEDPDAGNADDVTIYKKNGPNEFFQIKSSVDGREPASIDWLIRPSKNGGPSILQGLLKIWQEHRDNGSKLTINFHTNRPAAIDDNFISLRDGKNGTVAKRLKESSSANVNRLKKQLTSHLNVTEEILYDFLDDVSFRIGRLYTEVRDDARTLMFAAGFRYDDEAITLGESIVRAWVTDAKRRLKIADIENEIKHLRRQNELPAASLVVQAIDRDPTSDTATVALDWVDSFNGDEPRTRRVLQDDMFWKNFRSEIQESAKLIRSRHEARVLVRGHMRLPTWFTIGVEFGRTAGFEEIVSFQGNSPWSSKGAGTKFPVKVVCDEKLSDKNEIAISIAVSLDPSQDVKNYLQSSPHNIGRYVCIIPAVGVGNTAFKNEKQVRQWSCNVRDLVREIIRNYRPSKIHLFLAIPHGAALLLGHLWDRMTPTQLYEDPGGVGHYSPSFFIPN